MRPGMRRPVRNTPADRAVLSVQMGSDMQASFHWPDSTSSKGELGGRLGGIWGPIQPFVGAYWVDQWSGNNKLNVLFGGGCPSCMNLEDTAPGQYGKVDVGFSIPNWQGLEASMKGAWLFGGDHTSGYAARLTVRWRW